MQDLTPAEILQSASGLAPEAPAAFKASEILKPPTFTFAFESPFPDLAGPVEVRYPTFGDLLEIERLALAAGGGAIAEWGATLRICLQKAPHGWYRLAAKGGQPEVALDTFPDGDGLQACYRNFLAWRRSFRG